MKRKWVIVRLCSGKRRKEWEKSIVCVKICNRKSTKMTRKPSELNKLSTPKFWRWWTFGFWRQWVRGFCLPGRSFTKNGPNSPTWLEFPKTKGWNWAMAGWGSSKKEMAWRRWGSTVKLVHQMQKLWRRRENRSRSWLKSMDTSYRTSLTWIKQAFSMGTHLFPSLSGFVTDSNA